MIEVFSTVWPSMPKDVSIKHEDGDHAWGSKLFEGMEIIAHRSIPERMKRVANTEETEQLLHIATDASTLQGLHPGVAVAGLQLKNLLKIVILATTLFLTVMVVQGQAKSDMFHEYKGYAGSKSCIECHEKFYSLWSTSRHGLAMQPYNAEFAKTQLTTQVSDVVIGKLKYRVDLTKGLVRETGTKVAKQYRIEHVLGGKNVYYFLTPFKRGRLQTLPVAYDVQKKAWFDTAASGIRHFPGADRDQPVSWRDSAYTFNTGCYNCHVSQLSTNYNPKTDAYKTTWAEPGINCETCHGPSAGHNRVMKETPKGRQPKELKIISVKKFTPDQHNAACSGCHAKAAPITDVYPPGDRFFDHFDLVTLEDHDFYPDGRDLGENYTYTSWLMSPCAKAGKLNCVSCHTSSGRYRFTAKEKVNDACLPCHEKHVKNAPAHTRHKLNSPANKCISCHMPMTSFARMNRTDHSMLPPTPAVTIAYKSPNACNLCHTDKDAAWADKYVRQWRLRDYQAPVLKRAGLIDSARKRDWKQLPAMLDYIASKDRGEVFATSLIRLISPVQDPNVLATLLTAAKDPSPLVRAAAVRGLSLITTRESLQALIEATGDEYRLVRVRAAAGVATFPRMVAQGVYEEQLKKANQEYLAFIMARPDQWTSHYNVGNYQLSRGKIREAVASYQAALKREPQAVMAMVNSSIAYAQMGESAKAEKFLQKALKIAPDNAAANFNMGLMKAENNDPKGAEQYLKKALKSDPRMAQAAYNLCIITSQESLGEAVTWCRKAVELRPHDPRYAYTLAFYLNQKGERDEAVKTLQGVVDKYPGHKDARMLLGEITTKGEKSTK